MVDAMAFYSQHEVAILIVILGLVTLATRAGGYLVLARFKRIPAPLQAGLEAVPAAVITTLVLPPALTASSWSSTPIALRMSRTSPLITSTSGRSTVAMAQIAGKSLRKSLIDRILNFLAVRLLRHTGGESSIIQMKTIGQSAHIFDGDSGSALGRNLRKELIVIGPKRVLIGGAFGGVGRRRGRRTVHLQRKVMKL